MDQKIKHLDCVCTSPEHTLRFMLDDEELYTEVFLNNPNNFFKRMWIAIKYVFGYKCKYGHFDCFVMKPGDEDKLIELCEIFKEKRSAKYIQ